MYIKQNCHKPFKKTTPVQYYSGYTVYSALVVNLLWIMAGKEPREVWREGGFEGWRLL